MVPGKVPEHRQMVRQIRAVLGVALESSKMEYLATLRVARYCKYCIELLYSKAVRIVQVLYLDPYFVLPLFKTIIITLFGLR